MEKLSGSDVKALLMTDRPRFEAQLSVGQQPRVEVRPAYARHLVPGSLAVRALQPDK